MKISKIFLGVSLMVVSLFLISSCSKDNLATDGTQIDYQNNGIIEKTATYADFKKLNEQMEIYGYQPVTITEELDIANLRSVTSDCPCSPSLSDITTYNLGGNVRGFSVNSGGYGVCNRQITWYATPGVVINWQNGSFAKMTFPDSGTYYVYAIITSTHEETNCTRYAFSPLQIVI